MRIGYKQLGQYVERILPGCIAEKPVPILEVETISLYGVKVRANARLLTSWAHGKFGADRDYDQDLLPLNITKSGLPSPPAPGTKNKYSGYLKFMAM